MRDGIFVSFKWERFPKLQNPKSIKEKKKIVLLDHPINVLVVYIMFSYCVIF